MDASAIVASVALVVAAAAQWGALPWVPLLAGDALCTETMVAVPAGREATVHAGPAEGDGPVTDCQHVKNLVRGCAMRFELRHVWGPR